MSKGGHYHTSDGQTLTESQIKKLISKAKEGKLSDQLNEWGYNFCEKSIMHDIGELDNYVLINDLDYKILQCSHKISVKDAKESGRAELCYDKDNIQIICQHCHKLYDNNLLKFRK